MSSTCMYRIELYNTSVNVGAGPRRAVWTILIALIQNVINLYV